jgi:cytochrome c oxidase subunit 2
MNIEKLLYLPPVASSHGAQIDFIIFLVHCLMAVLFIGWGIYFVYVIFRFRQRKGHKANHIGTTSHVSNKIEIAIVVFEIILLFGFSIPFWAKQVNALPERGDIVELKVVAEQFAWNAHYPGPDKKFGKTDWKFFDKQSNPLGIDPQDPNGKDDFATINQIHMPIGKPAVIHLTSKDVMHSFGVPNMRAKQDVIPGMSIPIWFTPIKTGQFEVVCSQLCGLGHYKMRGVITVESEEQYQAWVDSQVKSAGESGEDSFWN